MLVSGIMIVIFSTLLWFGSEAHIIKDEEKMASRTYPILEEVPDQARGIMTSSSTGMFGVRAQTMRPNIVEIIDMMMR